MALDPKTNPLGLDGIDFVEVAGPDPEMLHRLLLAFGFSRTLRHAERPVDLYEQHDIKFLLSRDPDGHAGRFARLHGPSIVSMGWRCLDADLQAQFVTEGQ